MLKINSRSARNRIVCKKIMLQKFLLLHKCSKLKEEVTNWIIYV